ncbi:YciE/YciF ferroxidase family protein [Lunatibacter salilacus]|uniref:YciE/YciF ferroxidase family protein n=1 Tax=Lunatibacter salilacus TaxID=2483804 RepID=UPI00131C4ADC|nr:ferritin-like domain-containing protein [Lunatibacter salilacus]
MATTQKNGPSKKMKDSKFHQLFLHELKDIYWAEKNLLKALPKMAKGATSSKLAEALTNHVEETKNQVNRLEEVFELLDEKAKAEKCEAMEGLISEANDILEDTKSDTMVRDAGIIVACQKVEHYEIASYGSLVAMAKKMGHDEVAKILEQTLNEEKKADKLLTEMAESEINEEASAE